VFLFKPFGLDEQLGYLFSWLCCLTASSYSLIQFIEGSIENICLLSSSLEGTVGFSKHHFYPPSIRARPDTWSRSSGDLLLSTLAPRFRSSTLCLGLCAWCFSLVTYPEGLEEALRLGTALWCK